MKEGGQKAVNMSKTSEVLQGPDESPSQFYEHLFKAFCLYTPFDPEAAKNQRMINAAFVGQTQSLGENCRNWRDLLELMPASSWSWPQRCLSIEIRRQNGRPTG
jgi:hypothetical protein